MGEHVTSLDPTQAIHNILHASYLSERDPITLKYIDVLNIHNQNKENKYN